MLCAKSCRASDSSKTAITFMVHPTIRNKPEPFQPEYSRNWKEGSLALSMN